MPSPIFGTVGSDLLNGLPDDDFIIALEGNDTVRGLQGNDTLNGSQGQDIVEGGAGSDLVYGGKDNDQVRGDFGNDTLWGDFGNDTVDGSAGNDFVLGNFGDDLLFGNVGDDNLNGNFGNDTLVAGQGNDMVRGGLDNDLLFGEAGNDILSGDKGIDILIGGDGDDLFLLRKGIGAERISEADIISDFGNGNDLIGLSDGLKFEDLNISQGIDNNASDTIIQDKITGQFLAVLQGTNTSTINRAKFANPGSLAFRTARFRVNEDGTPVAAVTVTRTDGSDRAISVTLTPSDATATDPADYDRTPIFLNLDAGETSKTVKIPFNEDILDEPDETINLVLENPTGGAIIGAQSTAVLEIVDNDNGVGVPLNFTFRNPNGNRSDDFGFAVAAAGNNVLIGAPDDLAGDAAAGAAYLFDAIAGTLVQTFLNPNPDLSKRFGESVAAIGNNVLIGAPYDNTAKSNTGAAYLFDTTTGRLLQTFLNPTPERFDGFGESVAAVGNKVLIAAPGDDTAGKDAGAVYLFDRTTGALVQTFLNPSPREFNSFGQSLTAVGNKFAIAAPAYNRTGGESGAVYLYDGTTGANLLTFSNPNRKEFDDFGQSVAALGNNLLIGASLDDTAAKDAGAVYLFDSTTGALLQTFLNPTPNEFDDFGQAIGPFGNNVLIGAPGDDKVGKDAGAVHLFDASTGVLLNTFLNPNPKMGFGYSLASFGNRILIGEFDPSAGTGAAYVL